MLKLVYSAPFTALIIFLLSSCIGPPEKVPPITSPIVWLNRPPSFQLPSFKGKVTLFVFFTEDCKNCRELQPILNKIIKGQEGKVQILGVYTPIPDQEAKIDQIRLSLKANNIHYPVLYDSNSAVLRAFRVVGWPTLIISNSEAKITQHLHGLHSAAAIQSAVDKALKSNNDKKD